MKKLMIILIILGLFLWLTSEQNLRFCRKLFGTKPEQEKKEYFRSLSQNYYGSPDYWHELALVNDQLSPDQLVIPSLKAVNRLKNEQSVKALQD